MLYRVTQESLSNVVQHSGASSVRVELSSHAHGGLTQADFALATEIDGLPTDR